MRKVLLAHGGGGQQTWKLIKDVFLKHLGNEHLLPMEDAAVISTEGRVALTTDGFTVKPLFFKGGDIGKLAVAGTVNDLAVMGAKPLFMTVGFIVEEGFPLEDLERIVLSMSRTAQEVGVKVVAGDTKVVPSGQADGVFITASGLGKVIYEGLSAGNVKPGDAILVSGSVGDHGACILMEREGLEFETDLKSDCAPLWSLIERLLEAGIEIHAMRDPTRGGLSAVLYEWATSSQVSFLVEETAIPVREEVHGICEFLGLESYHLACEGRVVIALPEREAQKALDILRSHPLGEGASLIGYATEPESSPKVVLRTEIGTERILEPPSGELLPRIC